MPLTLIATPGASTANTYSTIAEAATWHASQLGGDAWFTQQEQQAVALATATAMLDRTCVWRGGRASTTQALGWPRHGVYYADSLAVGEAGEFGAGVGTLIPSTLIPLWLQQATAEFAKTLLLEQRADDPATMGLTSLRIGPFSFGVGSQSSQRQPFSPVVRQLLAPYVVTTGSSIAKRVVRY